MMAESPVIFDSQSDGGEIHSRGGWQQEKEEAFFFFLFLKWGHTVEQWLVLFLYSDHLLETQVLQRWSQLSL